MDKETHGCVCGICGHHSYIECKNSECECCDTFHNEFKSISETA